MKTPVDAFIKSALEQNGIAPAPPADRPHMASPRPLRPDRLPPTPAEAEAFLADESPEAYDRLIDDLLDRPAYGERWARHWLDVVRYAESNGYERDGAKPHAWRYRDYVIEAFRKDKPFDRFLTEQLAGDELEGADAESQIATTFLRLGTWDDEPADPRVDRYDQLDDVLGVASTTFLGLTIRCARCHDHKFEPFSQKDYYRLLAVFEPLKTAPGQAQGPRSPGRHRRGIGGVPHRHGKRRIRPSGGSRGTSAKRGRPFSTGCSRKPPAARKI